MIIQTMPYPYNPGDVALTFDGAWTWRNDPRAIVWQGNKIGGGVTSTGALQLFYEGGTITLEDPWELDDHGHPTFLELSDGRLALFVCKHNGSNLYLYISDDTSFPPTFTDPPIDLDTQFGLDLYSYPQPIQLSGEVFMTFRADDGSTRQTYYVTTTDVEGTWDSPVKVLSNNGDGGWSPYVSIAANGSNRVDIFLEDGNPQATTTNSIRHLYYDETGGTFHESDGTSLTLPVAPETDLDAIYDGSNGQWGRIWDSTVDGSGNPACLFAVRINNLDLRYRRAYWNGSSFDVTEVCTAGQGFSDVGPYYAGGVCFDPGDPDRVFSSRSIYGETHQIWRHEFSAGWSAERITEEADIAVRPYRINGAGQPALAYMTGDYNDFDDFDTDIVLTNSNKADLGYPTASSIAFRGAQVVRVGTGDTSYTLNDLQGGDDGVSTSIAEGDVIIAVMGYARGGEGGKYVGNYQFVRAKPGTPNVYADDVIDTNLGVFKMIASEDGAISGTISGAASTLASTCIFYVFSGPHPLFDATATTATGINGAAIDPPSITPSTSGALALFAGASGHAPASLALIERAAGLGNGNEDGHAGSAAALALGVALKRDWTSGAINPVAWNWDGATADSSMAAMAIAMKPDPGTGDADYGKRVFIAAGGPTNGGAPKDYGPHALQLTASGDAQTTTGTTLGGLNAILLDGTGDYVSLESGYIGPLDFMDAQDWAIDLKVRFASVAVQQVLLSRYATTDNNRSFLLRFDPSGGLQFYFSSDGASNSNVIQSWSPSAGTTYDVRVSRSGSTIRLFIDGVYKTKTTFAGSFFRSTAPFRIGTYFTGGTPSSFLNGRIAVRMTNVALSTADSDYTPDSTWATS